MTTTFVICDTPFGTVHVCIAPVYAKLIVVVWPADTTSNHAINSYGHVHTAPQVPMLGWCHSRPAEYVQCSPDVPVTADANIVDKSNQHGSLLQVSCI